MNPDQAVNVRNRIIDLRNRLQQVRSLLHGHSPGSEAGINPRDNLGLAIRLVEQVSEELAVLCDDPLGDPADRSFLETREREAKSEVDSGEFDMHG